MPQPSQHRYLPKHEKKVDKQTLIIIFEMMLRDNARRVANNNYGGNNKSFLPVAIRLYLGQFVIIRHVIKYFFYSLECASCKVRNLSNCTARKSAKFCREKKSGKYIYASRSYRGLEYGSHRSIFADFLHGDHRCTC